MPAGGYHVCLDHLTSLLDGQSTVALTDPNVQAEADRWQRTYSEVLGTQS